MIQLTSHKYTLYIIYKGSRNNILEDIRVAKEWI